MNAFHEVPAMRDLHLPVTLWTMPGAVGWVQATCSCGWTGPIRSDGNGMACIYDSHAHAPGAPVGRVWDNVRTVISAVLVGGTDLAILFESVSEEIVPAGERFFSTRSDGVIEGVRFEVVGRADVPGLVDGIYASARANLLLALLSGPTSELENPARLALEEVVAEIVEASDGSLV